jgi:hypothetical protein
VARTVQEDVFKPSGARGVDRNRLLTSARVPTPALPVSAYVGTYTNKFIGDIQIIEEGDRLAIVEGPRKFDSPIKAL